MSIQDDDTSANKYEKQFDKYSNHLNSNDVTLQQHQHLQPSATTAPSQQITLNVNYQLTYNIKNNENSKNITNYYQTTDTNHFVENGNADENEELEPELIEEIINLHYEHFRTETLTNFVRQLNTRSLSCSSGGATYFDSSDEEGVPIPREIRENFQAKIIKDHDPLTEDEEQATNEKTSSGRESKLKQLFKSHSLKKSSSGVSGSSTANDLHSLLKKLSCLKRIQSVVDINHNPTNQEEQDNEQNNKSDYFWSKKKQPKHKLTYLNGKTGQKLTKNDIVHCQQFSIDQEIPQNNLVDEDLLATKQQELNIPKLQVEEKPLLSATTYEQQEEAAAIVSTNNIETDTYETEPEDYSSIVVGHRDPFDSEADPTGRPFRYHRRSHCNCHRDYRKSLSSVSSSSTNDTKDFHQRHQRLLPPPPPIPHNTPDSIADKANFAIENQLNKSTSELSLKNYHQQSNHNYPSQSSINQFDSLDHSELFLEPNYRSISDCNFHRIEEVTGDPNKPNIIHILAPPSSLFLSSSSNPSLLNYATTTTVTDTTTTGGATTQSSTIRFGSEDRLLVSLEQPFVKMIHHNNNNNVSSNAAAANAAKYFMDPNSPQPPNQPSYVNISRVNHGYVPYNRYTSEYRRDDSLLRYPDRYQMQPSEDSSKGFLHRKVESLYGQSFADDWNENRHKVKKGQSIDKSPGAGSETSSQTTADQIKSTLAGSKLFQKINSIDNSDIESNKPSSFSQDNKDWWLREHQALLDQPHHNGGSGSGASDNTPQGFLNKLQEQRAKLGQKIQHGEKWLSNPKDIPEEYLGKIRAAIGKANLLLDKKFQQFQKLCEDSINQGDKEAFKIQNDDLQGFWDMMMIQVNDVNITFEQLIKLKQNQWKMTPGMMMTMDYHQHQQQTSPRTTGHNKTAMHRKDSPQRKFDNNNNNSNCHQSPRDEERQRRLQEIKRRGKMMMQDHSNGTGNGEGADHQMITIFAKDDKHTNQRE